MTDPLILDVLATLAMIVEGDLSLSWNNRRPWYPQLVNSIPLSSP